MPQSAKCRVRMIRWYKFYDDWTKRFGPAADNNLNTSLCRAKSGNTSLRLVSSLMGAFFVSSFRLDLTCIRHLS